MNKRGGLSDVNASIRKTSSHARRCGKTVHTQKKISIGITRKGRTGHAKHFLEYTLNWSEGGKVATAKRAEVRSKSR